MAGGAHTYSAQFNALDAAMTAVSSMALQIGGPATGFYNPGFLPTFLDDSRVNTNSSADTSTVAIAGGGSLSAAEWQISKPASPVDIGTLSTTDGTFSLTLPAQSVTTLVVT
jgi:O-glycosyl hydrolase